MGLFDDLINSVKAAVENTASAESTTEKPAEKAAQPEVTPPQTENIRFGSRNPVPYTQEINGAEAKLLVRYYGTAEFDIKDPAIVESCGGIEAVKTNLENEICDITNVLVQKCSSEEHLPISRLSSRSSDFAGFIIRQSKASSWQEHYGVELIRVGFGGFALTEDSKKAYDELKKAQLQQAFAQYTAQPQTPAAPAAWQCPNCGAQNAGKFCTNCGTKLGQ